MQLKIICEKLVPQPAVSATPAGPDAAFTIVFSKSDDSNLVVMTDVVGSGPSRSANLNKSEASAIAGFLEGYVAGIYD